MADRRDLFSITKIVKRVALGFIFLGLSVAFGDDPVTQWINVVEKNKGVTVLIRVDTEGQDSGFGSGVIIGPGRVLTAKHVLPDDPTRERGNFLIKGLVGWDEASIDFAQARKLVIEYVSVRYDLAILRFESGTSTEPHAFSTGSLKQGQSILVMGYPDGGSLTCTQGIVSNKNAGGTWGTDATVGVGNSGGPLFDPNGSLVGILLEGSAGRDGKARSFWDISWVLMQLARNCPPPR